MNEEKIAQKQLEILAEVAFLTDCMCHGVWDVECAKCNHKRYEKELAVPCMIDKSRKITIKQIEDESL